jgi:RNA polymerase sigma-54 factor
MTMRQSLELRQTQRLAMTAQLRQSIAMLRMTAPELEALLAAEAERNPLLSLDPPGVDAEAFAPSPRAAEAEAYAPRTPPPSAVAPPGPDALDGAAALSAPVTLADHVRAQLALSGLDPAARAAADLLCADLEEDGYLRVDLAEAAERLGAPVALLERAAAAIRGCDPTGVGAPSLAECLRLQLAEQGALDAAAAALLDRLELLPTTPPARLAAICGVSVDALGAAIAGLRALDPRPGRRFAPPPPAPAFPDVVVEPDGAGGWRVALNAESTPRLCIDADYAVAIARAGDAPARRFLGECARSADWLRRSLEQRARTILTVAAEIVARQEGFLARGVDALRPMTLREVAEAVALHESTVSRATAHKTIATPRGVFELRFFFSAALARGDDGETRAAAAVRARIRALVAEEPAGRPLSDDALARALKGEGVAVARRTVAKYREAMGIPASSERRRRAGAAAALC